MSQKFASADKRCTRFSHASLAEPNSGAAEGAEPELGSASEACENLVQRLSADANFCDMRRKDQRKAIEMLHRSELGKLRRAEAPLLDLELRGVPALQYFGSQLWQ